MRNLRYTYLIPKSENDKQKKLSKQLIDWANKQSNVSVIKLNTEKVEERNKFQIAAVLKNDIDLEKAKNELNERIKRHFQVYSGQIIYLSDKKIGQIYEENKNRPYFVLKSFTSNNKIVILQITTKKHKMGVQYKIKLNGNISYVIIDEPLTLKRNEIFNARSDYTKANQNENIVMTRKIDKFFIFRKFKKSFKG